ncbi:hypothetical protein [Loktanella sp. S4079]|uniref:hypothetical protein n=1 Tax=Loktanella sp. S4079 TaxID=579483 RepID=UPI0005F9F38F|nr:hypothetical protein [Loktanella sp. S4079]KJZ19581.1 hypothetical protein TW80_01325 [Loktanella sp. S4079]
MKNSLKLSAIIAFASMATTAAAECTEALVQEKTTEISTGVQALAATDPEKMMEITTALQTAMTEAAAAEDMEAVCTSLDEILAELNG